MTPTGTEDAEADEEDAGGEMKSMINEEYAFDARLCQSQ
jgi:hypothetical protein